MIHIRNVHYKDVRKMFASDAIEHLEADEEYHMWLNAITYVKKDGDGDADNDEVLEGGLCQC